MLFGRERTHEREPGSGDLDAVLPNIGRFTTPSLVAPPVGFLLD